MDVGKEGVPGNRKAPDLLIVQHDEDAEMLTQIQVSAF